MPSVLARTANTLEKISTKRGAIHSPATSPQKDNTTHHNITMDEHEPLTPNNLEMRFKSHLRYKMMTMEEAHAKVAGDEWKSAWDHPQMILELISEPKQPNPGEVFPYEFDHEDNTTQQLLKHLNGKMIEMTTWEHVLSIKKQEVSRMHPHFDPFTISILPPDKIKCTVVNCKKEQAFTFKQHDYILDCMDMDFDLDDSTTYSILCILTPTLL